MVSCLPQFVSLSEHIRIIGEVVKECEQKASREMASIKKTLDDSEAKYAKLVSDTIATRQNAFDLEAVNKNMQANLKYYQDDNTKIRSKVVAAIKALELESRPI